MATAIRTNRKTLYLVRHVREQTSLLTSHPEAGYEILATWYAVGDLFDDREEWRVSRNFGGEHTINDLESAFLSHLNNPGDGLQVTPVEMLGILDFETDDEEEAYKRGQNVTKFTVTVESK